MARAPSSSRTAICAVSSARTSTSVRISRAILECIASTLGSDTHVNLMDQFFPAGKVSESAYSEINRRLTSAEFREAEHTRDDFSERRPDGKVVSLRVGRLFSSRSLGRELLLHGSRAMVCSYQWW
jgi:hypothetical protein